MIVPALIPTSEKLCCTWPSFLMLNWMQPAGTDCLSRTKRYSTMLTLTVVDGLVHATGVVVVVVVVDVVVVVVGVVVVTRGAATPTPNVPFIPTLAWPGTVQM